MIFVAFEMYVVNFTLQTMEIRSISRNRISQKKEPLSEKL
jgi:hypothetical protein